MGRRPVPFSQYCYPLLRFSREHNFMYPYVDWPPGAALEPAAGRAGAAQDGR